MASTVHIAEIRLDDRSEILGAFSTQAKAVNACKYHWLNEQTLMGVCIDVALEAMIPLHQSKSYVLFSAKGTKNPVITYEVQKARVR